ncbi:MAG TPA: HAMP domain-containing protein [Ktedonobacteraceae bacterium]|jgi:methyl-accepting chemotaxis protein
MNSADQHMMKPAPPHLRSQSFSGSPAQDSPRKPLAPGYHLLLSWPIARRLVLGFLTAAVIAAAVSSITGIERTNTLQNQAQFYRGLVDSNSQLTKSDGFLQLMNTGLNQAVATAQSGGSSGSQGQTIQNVQGLASSYDTILTNYAQHNLIDENPDQQALIHEAGSDGLIIKQRTLASSALRTWQTYRDAQNGIINDIENNNLAAAQQFNTNLATPTHNDALSALRALIQSEGELADSVLSIEGIEERNQLIITLVGALIAFIAVGIVGWFISGTIVPRLQDLRNVVQSVEDGRFDSRVFVSGRDEIAQVAASVNTMLNTIVGLLEEARHQRDALTSAADSLFSDMRVVGAGDLRVNAAVSNDPVGMLANAFNLTVGRFRRLVLRTRTSMQQIDVVFRQEIKHAESSIAVAKRVLSSHELEAPESVGQHPLPQQTLSRLHQVRSLMQMAANQGTEAAMNSVLAQIEHAYHLTQQLETRSIPEVSKIQQTLLKAGQEMHTLHTNIANALSLVTTIEGEIVTSAQGSSLDKGSSLLSSGSNSVSKQELARFYLEFAQEIIAATSKLRSIIQEMQVSLTTFQVEVP